MTIWVEISYVSYLIFSPLGYYAELSHISTGDAQIGGVSFSLMWMDILTATYTIS